MQSYMIQNIIGENMEIKIFGVLNSEAKVALKVEPEMGTTIVKGVAPNVELFTSTNDLINVGSVPAEVDFTILFYRRPWKFSLYAKSTSEEEYNNSSEEQDLPSTIITTPDIVPIKVIFEEN